MQTRENSTEEATFETLETRRRAISFRGLTRLGPRIARSLIGLALLVVAAAVFYKHVILNVSSDAVVVSEFIDVAAPIEGFIEHPPLEAGAVLPAGQTLGTIKNPRVDKRGVAELNAKLEVVDGDIHALESIIATLDGLGMQFASRGDTYRKRRGEQLKLLVAQSQSRLDSDRARLAETRSRVQRVEALMKLGLAPEQRSEEAHRDATVAERSQFASERELESYAATLNALNEGYNLGDFSSADKSYSSQRHDEILLRLAQLRGDLADKRAQRPALSAQLEIERAHLTAQSEAVLQAPRRSRVWSVGVADGVFVSRGTQLVRLVDCTRLRVLAYVTERNYDAINVGDRVDIRIQASGRRFEGHVDLRLGPPDLRLPASGALTVPLDQRERFAVTVSSPDLTAALTPTCDVGQNVEVTFRGGR